MITASTRPQTRAQSTFTHTLIAAALAVTGTFATFAATTTPAAAQTPAKGYSASLVSPVDAPRREVIGGVLWKCEGSACAAPLDGSRAQNSCARLVRKVGPITRFASPKGELSAEDLQRCNAAA